MTRPILCVASALTLAAAVTAFARPAPNTANVPTTLPSAGANAMPLADLEQKAIDRFEAGDYANALPLLKDLSIRLRNSPEKVAPILEKVRVCEANIATQQQVIEGINGPRTAHPKPKEGETYELELQKLGNFAYDADKGGNIPDDVKALSGTTVKLHGFMIPIDESDKVTKFVLVPSLFACCFGQPPQLQHTAVVVCPKGKAVTYYPEEISVVGPLKVEEKRDEGYVTNIFEVQATSIRPVAK